MDKKKPYLAVILIQSIYAGMFLLSKAAFDGGMNNFVFVFYRQAAATVILVPLALFFEWKTAPPLSLLTFCKIFVLSLCGITLSLDINGVALVYTSATLAAATTNCLPVITFFFAVLLSFLEVKGRALGPLQHFVKGNGVIMGHGNGSTATGIGISWGQFAPFYLVPCRMEVLRLKTVAGIAKIVGIIICLAGALTLAFYKGPHIKLFCLHQLFAEHQHSQTVHRSRTSSGETWIKGCLLMLISNTFWGLWLVLQGRVLKSYPSKLLFTALQCFLTTIQSFAIAIALERDPYEWRVGWNVRLLAVAYCGIVVTGVTFYLQAWVIEDKGPVFLAMSTPLNLILTILCSAILLCEIISVGSLLGGLLLICGLYSVLWGKTKEQRMLDENCLPAHHVDKDCTELKVMTA